MQTIGSALGDELSVTEGQSFWSALRAAPRHALLPKGGAVINVSSGAAANPFVGWSAYCASKAGLSILTRVLAIEESQLLSSMTTRRFVIRLACCWKSMDLRCGPI
jgi:hypothetical protein